MVLGKGQQRREGILDGKGKQARLQVNPPSFFHFHWVEIKLTSFIFRKHFRCHFHFHWININLPYRYYGPPEPLMKKERKPVAVVEEAPYEGPTIFDKVTAAKENYPKISFSEDTNPFSGFQNQKARQELNGGQGGRRGGRLEEAKGGFPFTQLISPISKLSITNNRFFCQEKSNN